MKWYLFVGFFISTFMFYLLGNSDGENKSMNGLIIWLVAISVVLVWNVATWWATR